MRYLYEIRCYGPLLPGMLREEDIEQRLVLQQGEQYEYVPILIPSKIPGHPPIVTFFSEYYETMRQTGENAQLRLPSLQSRADQDDERAIPLPELTVQPYIRRLEIAEPAPMLALQPEVESFEIHPEQLVVYFHGEEEPSVSSTFQRAGFRIAPRGADQRFNICWGHPLGLDFYKTLAPGELCGQFPGSNAIGRKDTMANLLNEARIKYGEVYNFYPRTFNIPDDLDSFNQYADSDKYYIYKPAMSSEGRGIELFRLGDEAEVIKENTPAVIEEYVDDLLLVNGYKFDLRLYVLVTSIDPLIFYFYNEGLGRFATTPYEHVNEANYREKTMHLTNFSINYKSDQFHMDGFPSKWKYSELLRYLDENRYFFSKSSPIHENEQKGAVQAFIQPLIDDLICLTLFAVEPRMYLFSHNAGLADVYPRRNFGLYGFDIMLLSDGRPMLVEINKSPSKNTKTALDIELKYPLMANALSLVGYSPAFFQTGLSCVPERFDNEEESEMYRFGGRLKCADCRQFQEFKGDSRESFKDSRDYLRFAEMRDLSEYERRCLWQLVDEESRLGGFRRLWPNENEEYLRFLHLDRYLSHMCCWFCKRGVKGLEELKEIGI